MIINPIWPYLTFFIFWISFEWIHLKLMFTTAIECYHFFSSIDFLTEDWNEFLTFNQNWMSDDYSQFDTTKNSIRFISSYLLLYFWHFFSFRHLLSNPDKKIKSVCFVEVWHGWICVVLLSYLNRNKKNSFYFLQSRSFQEFVKQSKLSSEYPKKV